MYAAALDGKAPRILRYERFGVPYACVALTTAIGLLSYVSSLPISTEQTGCLSKTQMQKTERDVNVLP